MDEDSDPFWDTGVIVGVCVAALCVICCCCCAALYRRHQTASPNDVKIINGEADDEVHVSDNTGPKKSAWGDWGSKISGIDAPDPLPVVAANEDPREASYDLAAADNDDGGEADYDLAEAEGEDVAGTARQKFKRSKNDPGENDFDLAAGMDDSNGEASEGEGDYSLAAADVTEDAPTKTNANNNTTKTKNKKGKTKKAVDGEEAAYDMAAADASDGDANNDVNLDQDTAGGLQFRFAGVNLDDLSPAQRDALKVSIADQVRGKMGEGCGLFKIKLDQGSIIVTVVFESGRNADADALLAAIGDTPLTVTVTGPSGKDVTVESSLMAADDGDDENVYDMANPSDKEVDENSYDIAAPDDDDAVDENIDDIAGAEDMPLSKSDGDDEDGPMRELTESDERAKNTLSQLAANLAAVAEVDAVAVTMSPSPPPETKQWSPDDSPIQKRDMFGCCGKPKKKTTAMRKQGQPQTKPPTFHVNTPATSAAAAAIPPSAPVKSLDAALLANGSCMVTSKTSAVPIKQPQRQLLTTDC